MWPVAERLQKILSAAGLCSRRTAEQWLLQGRVTVNGQPARLGQKAEPGQDRICVDGRPLEAPPERVCLMLHKPRGYVSTLSDEEGRPTVAQLVAGCGVRVYPIGRLDMASEGLLLLTNDGALANRVLHPRHGVNKIYRVTVTGDLAGCAERLGAIRALEDGEPILPAQVRLLILSGGRAELEVVIHQGKNRQIRRMCALAGLRVRRLVRVGEGPLVLGDLESGKWRYLTETELEMLRHE